MAVSVRKLIQRGQWHHAVRDRIALEDALHTTLPDDKRLVLVRRLRVSGEIADPAHRQNAIRRGWVEAVSGAVHGSGAAADKANCVWFASHGEAEALLLRKLLAGERVDGWFWPLAVPDWRRLPLSHWLERVVVRCLLKGETARLTRIAETFVQTGHVARIVEIIERALPTLSPASVDLDRVLNHPSASATTPASLRPDHEGVAAARIAVQLAPRVLPPQWQQLIAGLDRSTVPNAATELVIASIVEERVRRASPALSLRPRLVTLIARAMQELGTGSRFASDDVPPATRVEEAAPSRGADDEHAHPDRRGLTQAREEHSDSQIVEPEAKRPELRQLKLADHARPDGRPLLGTSHHAGLWLVVPSLMRLGLGEWLSARTDLLGDHPGRALLLAVARHHRVGLDDPALAPLAPFGAADETLADWTAMWRLGLDRWLRRTARRRTHDLVVRAGKVALGEYTADIHFPLEAADLRLRRQALDRDPGWVVWLGLSVRYHFGTAVEP